MAVPRCQPRWGVRRVQLSSRSWGGGLREELRGPGALARWPGGGRGLGWVGGAVRRGRPSTSSTGLSSFVFMWPTASPVECFTQRRQRLLERFAGPAVFASGLPRVRNFEGNRFPFRAESHFLYFVGQHIEEALLSFEGGRAVLYVQPQDPSERLWHGPQPSLSELSDELGMEVRPLAEFAPELEVATLPPSDVDSVLWLEDLLGRVVEPDSSSEDDDELADNELALVMVGLRLKHDLHAISQMRQAAEVTRAAHLAAMATSRPAIREAQVRAALEARMLAAGMLPAYESIVTVHGNVLHNTQSRCLMQSSDWLLVDAGAETPEGWASDVTRSYPVNGRFEGVAAEVYEVLLSAQRAAIERLRPGVRFADVHLFCCEQLLEGLIALGLLRGTATELLERDVAAALFPHGLGHLLGLDVHDMEDLGDLAGYPPGRQRSDAPALRYLRLDRELEPGMVVTIEPGIYDLAGLVEASGAFELLHERSSPQFLEALRSFRGMRIEDDVLITSDGSEVLTAAIPKHPSDLLSHLGIG